VIHRRRRTPSPRLFPDFSAFPATRYQGSKRKLMGTILRRLDNLEYETVLDAFGGTGAMSYAFKCAGKRVTYNDLLAFNEQIGLALIANDDVPLTEDEAATVCTRHSAVNYDDFIERTFPGIYFTNEENRWLDTAVRNIRLLADSRKRAIAWFALFQSAMAKRPYNLFHRRNLYMRLAEVERGFGNKASWDRPFPEHFAQFAAEANAALVDGGGACRVLRRDVQEIKPEYDLVYFDPPYLNAHGVGVDYRDFYHFLEGLVQYERWPDLIDRESKHLRLTPVDNPWSDPMRSPDMFRRVFSQFRNAVLVVSYRSDGTPGIDELQSALREVKTVVRVEELETYQYALSKQRQTREVLIIGL
jgi:adenine-specific DNA-methyltransferase